jgi:flagellar operon protein
MLLNDFLKTQNRQISVSTGQPPGIHGGTTKAKNTGASFAEILAEKSGVEFSGHAMRRIESRGIGKVEDSNANTPHAEPIAWLDRLNKGVELAAQKGSNDALVLVDSMAFVVSVKNNKVITTMDTNLPGNVFTNIDSTIII